MWLFPIFICFGFFCYDNLIANRYSSDKYQIVVKKLTKNKQTNKKQPAEETSRQVFATKKCMQWRVIILMIRSVAFLVIKI